MPDSILQDVRYSVRMLRRTPVFTAVAIVSLALGIGANTAIFSLVDALVLRSLPIHDPPSLVTLLSTFPGEPRTNGFSWKVYEHVRDTNQVFTDVAGVSAVRVRVASGSREAEPLDAEYV